MAGNDGAEIDELVYYLQGMVADGDCWCGADILAHDVGFLQADGEDELCACLCDSGDESLKSILRMNSERVAVCKEHLTDEQETALKRDRLKRLPSVLVWRKTPSSDSR